MPSLSKERKYNWIMKRVMQVLSKGVPISKYSLYLCRSLPIVLKIITVRIKTLFNRTFGHFAYI